MSVKPTTGRGRAPIMIGQQTATEARAVSKENKASAKSALIDAKTAHKAAKGTLRVTAGLHAAAKKAYDKNRKGDGLKDAYLSAGARLKEDTAAFKAADKGLAAANKAYDKAVAAHTTLEEKIKAKAAK